MKKCVSVLLVLVILFTSYGSALANTLKLPGQLKCIEDEAFYGDTAVDEVDLPWGTTAIGSLAFANSGLDRIYIPDTTEQIADDAFLGVDDVVICAPYGSYAQEYAEKHEYLWEDSGNHYRRDQFLATKNLYDELEYADEGTLYYEGIQNGLITDWATDDPRIRVVIDQYNALETEADALLEAHYANIDALVNDMNSLGETISDSSLVYSDDGVAYSGDGFTYFVNNSIMDELNGDYEIGAVSTEDNGNMTIELISGGNVYQLVGNVDGISAYGMNVMLKSRSVSYPVASYSKKRAGGSEGNAGLFETMLKKIMSFEGALFSFTQGVKAAQDNAAAFATAKYDQYLAIKNLLDNPGEMSDDVFRSLQDRAITAEKNYKIALRTVHVLDKAMGCLKVINPVVSINTIRTSYTRWKELGNIYEHGHPLSYEADDPVKMDLIRQMLDDIRTARTAYFCNALNSCLNLIDEISTVVALVGSLTGVGVGPALLQKAAVFLGLKGFRAMLMSFFAGVFMGSVGDVNYYKAKAEDKQLHGAVYGYVKDKDTGEPLKLAAVTCEGISVVTDSKGYYQISVSAGTHTLEFEKKGYKKEKETVTLYEDPDGESPLNRIRVDIELRPKSIILTREDLEAIEEDPDEDYIIGADIDLSDAPWTPLPYFNGTLDGGGHTVSGMRIEGEYGNTNLGLFNNLNGEIANLTMTGVTIAIHATGDFCNVATFGLPDGVWDTGASAAASRINNCTVSAIVSIHADEGCWTGYSPLTSAKDSSAKAHISIWGTHISENVLWNCVRCTAQGSVNVTYTGQPQATVALVRDSLSSTANFTVQMNQNDQPPGNSSFFGIHAQNIECSDDTVKGSVYNEGYSCAVNGGNNGADKCESSLSITSDNFSGLFCCTNSRLSGTITTIGKNSDTYAKFIEDSWDADYCGNICDAEYAYRESNGMKPANLNVYCVVSRGSEFNTPIVLEDITLSNVSVVLSSPTYQEGRYEGAEMNEQFRNGQIKVKTGSGFINIYSELSTNQNTYAESSSGKITVMAASYNTGNVTAKSESNTVQVTGGSKYNSGAVLGITHSNSGTSYVDGVYGTRGYNIGTVMGINYGAGTVNTVGVNGSEAWNEGTVTAENYGNGNVYANGIFGDDGVNKGAVTATGYGTNSAYVNGTMGWNIHAIGVNGVNGWNDAPVTASCDGSSHVAAVGCENGVNLGAITSTSGSGYSNAIGIRNGTHNGGEVSTTTGGDVARAWGAQYSGTNSASVSAVVTRSDISCDAHADAQGGTAYASGGKGHASGRNPTAHSTYTGQTVKNGYAWMFVSHNHGSEIICNPPMYRVTETSDGSYPYHTYFCGADATVTSDVPGNAPTAPANPQVGLPF